MKLTQLFGLFFMTTAVFAKTPPAFRGSARDIYFSEPQPSVIVASDSAGSQRAADENSRDVQTPVRRSAPPFYDGISNYGAPGLLGSQVYGFGQSPVQTYICLDGSFGRFPGMYGSHPYGHGGSFPGFGWPYIPNAGNPVVGGVSPWWRQQNGRSIIGNSHEPWGSFPGFGWSNNMPNAGNPGAGGVNPWWGQQNGRSMFGASHEPWGQRIPSIYNGIGFPESFNIPLQAGYSVEHNQLHPYARFWQGNGHLRGKLVADEGVAETTKRSAMEPTPDRP